MNVSPVSSAAPIQTELKAPAPKAAVPQPSTPAQPTDTVSLSSAAQKHVGGDVDHDGDSH